MGGGNLDGSYTGGRLLSFSRCVKAVGAARCNAAGVKHHWAAGGVATASNGWSNAALAETSRFSGGCWCWLQSSTCVMYHYPLKLLCLCCWINRGITKASIIAMIDSPKSKLTVAPRRSHNRFVRVIQHMWVLRVGRQVLNLPRTQWEPSTSLTRRSN
jgi:hypothetical protein